MANHKHRQNTQEEGKYYSGSVSVFGHGVFRHGKTSWTSHYSWVSFKVQIHRPLKSESEDDWTLRSIKMKYKFGQQSKVDPNGPYVKPFFKDEEMERMETKAAKIFAKRSLRPTEVPTEELVREATAQEADENKKHKQELCEYCRDMAVSCTGVVEILEGVTVKVVKRWFQKRFKMIQKLRNACSNGTCVPEGCKVLYHQTSAEAARMILESNQMLRGQQGMFGGGIYFAATPKETDNKAHQRGVILRCIVYLGNRKDVRAVGKHDFASLTKEHYDSVHAVSGNGFLGTGDEFIVYNRDQVIHIEKYRA